MLISLNISQEMATCAHCRSVSDIVIACASCKIVRMCLKCVANLPGEMSWHPAVCDECYAPVCHACITADEEYAYCRGCYDRIVACSYCQCRGSAGHIGCECCANGRICITCFMGRSVVPPCCKCAAWICNTCMRLPDPDQKATCIKCVESDIMAGGHKRQRKST
jgi:hypothetical protein